MGIQIRAAALAHSASSSERKQSITDGANRLIDPLGMGEQYKVLGIVAKGGGDAQDVHAAWPFNPMQP